MPFHNLIIMYDREESMLPQVSNGYSGIVIIILFHIHIICDYRSLQKFMCDYNIFMRSIVNHILDNNEEN